MTQPDQFPMQPSQPIAYPLDGQASVSAGMPAMQPPVGMQPAVPPTFSVQSAGMPVAVIDLSTNYKPAERTSFARTLKAELNKLVDTKASLVLLVVGLVLQMISVIAISSLGGWVTRGTPEKASFASTVLSSSWAMMLFLVIMAIMLATSEWTTRSSLTTFSLEPRRGRVLAAKVLVATGLAVTLSVLALPLGALGTLLTNSIADNGISWELDWKRYGLFVLASVLGTLFGMAWGLLTRSTVFGVVLYLAIPTVSGTLYGILAVMQAVNSGATEQQPDPHLLTTLDKYFLFLSPDTAGNRLQQGLFNAWTWGGYGVSQLLWVALPFVLGTVRWLRSEAK